MSNEDPAALLIKTGVEQMFAPFHQLLDKLLGPAATEVGLVLGDSLKVWRFRRQVRFLQEVKRIADNSGKELSPIATRLFFPVLEAASIEDDDDMQTRWAALLANEATNVGSVHPSFIEILRQLSPGDARLLDQLCDECERNKSCKIRPTGDIFRDHEMAKILEPHEDSLGNLVRLGLVQSEYDVAENGGSLRIAGTQAFLPPTYLNSWYELSDFAVRFVRACRAPREGPER